MEDLILNFSLLVIGVLSGFFSAYFKKKVENRALLEDVRRLEEEKRDVEKRFVLEIELVKKDHQLDIERRKYQYEEKMRVYNTFCCELDQYQSKGQVILKEKAMPVINNFLRSFELASGSKENIDHSFSNYFTDMIMLCNELNLAYVDLKNKSNKLRLITSTESEYLLDQLLVNLKVSTDLSNQMFQFLATPEGMTNEEKKQTYIVQLLDLDIENQNLRSALILQMKIELGCI